MHTRSLYIRMYIRAPFLRKGLFFVLLTLTTQNTPKTTKIDIAENQAVNKKSDFFCIFFAKIFGQFKNLLYLCIRFRSKMGHAPRAQANDL